MKRSATASSQRLAGRLMPTAILPAASSTLSAMPTSAYPYVDMSCSAESASRGGESAVNSTEIRADFMSRPRPGAQNPCKTRLRNTAGTAKFPFMICLFAAAKVAADSPAGADSPQRSPRGC